MINFRKYRRTLPQLAGISMGIHRIFDKKNPTEVDIERTLEEKYQINIDILPLDEGRGVQAFLNLAEKTVYVDLGLSDLDYNEKRYRFTLAEELAHYHLHVGLFQNVKTVEDYIKLYNSIPEEDSSVFELNAKALAGMILMPEDLFIKQLVQHRDSRLSVLGKEPGPEAMSLMVSEAQRELMDDFNVSEDAVRHRLRHVTILKKADFFSLKI